MKIEQLNYFLETARTEHIGKAARALHISPSAISHSISQLEEELGRELFAKKGKRIFLTPHGKMLMERSERLLREIESVREDLASETVGLQGYFRLAASHDLCTRFLSKAWAKLQKDNPELSGELFTYRSSQVAAGVISKQLDFGICFSPVAHPDLQVQVLRKGQLRVVVRKDHPIFKVKEKDRLKALGDYPATLPKAFQGVDVCERHAMFDKFGIHAKPSLLFDCYGVALDKVLNSDGWALVPDWLVKDFPGIKPLKSPVGWDAPYNVSAIWSKDRPCTRVLKQLCDYVARDVETAK